jgi:hypothetical protein
MGLYWSTLVLHKRDHPSLLLDIAANQGKSQIDNRLALGNMLVLVLTAMMIPTNEGGLVVFFGFLLFSLPFRTPKYIDRCVLDVRALVYTGNSNQLQVTVYNVDINNPLQSFLTVICPNPLDQMILVSSSCQGYSLSGATLVPVGTCSMTLTQAVEPIRNELFIASASVSADVGKVDAVLQCFRNPNVI